jgi:hypothetical protein
VRLLHDLVEDDFRIELRRQQAAGARELLCERAGAALGLEQLAALQCAADGAGEMPGELEVVLAERVRLVEEDRDEASRAVARADDRDRQERLETGARGRLAPGDRDTFVAREPRRGDVLPRSAANSSASDSGSSCDPLRARPDPTGMSAAAAAPPRASDAACAIASSVSARESDSPSTAAMR